MIIQYLTIVQARLEQAKQDSAHLVTYYGDIWRHLN